MAAAELKMQGAKTSTDNVLPSVRQEEAEDQFYDPVTVEAVTIAMLVVHRFAGVSYDCWPEADQLPTRAAKTMCRRVNEALQQHDVHLTALVNQHKLTADNGYTAFSACADQILAGNAVTWGRVVTLYALLAKLSENSMQNGMDLFTVKLPYILGIYVASTNVSRYVHQNGGWKEFIKLFTRPIPVGSIVFRSLFCIGLSLTGLAMFTKLVPDYASILL